MKRLMLVSGLFLLCGVVVALAILGGRRLADWQVAYVLYPEWEVTLLDTRTRINYSPLRGVGFADYPAITSDHQRIVGRTRFGILSVFDLKSGESIELDTGIVPAWSPDGAQIVYREERRFHLVTIEGDQIRREQLELDGRVHVITRLMWSPDGERVAVEGYYRFGGDTTDYEIFAIELDNSQLHNISNHATAQDYGTTWSPDGSQMIFVSNREGSPALYLVDVESGDLRYLAGSIGHITAINWSPDGTMLAVVLRQPGRSPQLAVIDLTDDAPALQHLAENVAELPVSWSPDSTHLAYAVDAPRRTVRLYTIGVRGDAQPRLLRTVDRMALLYP